MTLCLGTNKGVNITRREGTFDGTNVWLNDEEIANALSYGLLAKHSRSTGDSEYDTPIFYYSKPSG